MTSGCLERRGPMGFLSAPLFSRVDQIKKLIRLLLRDGYRRALGRGAAAAIEHEFVLKLIEPATLIDIGANVGQFSVVAKTLHPGLRIHAFEPMNNAADVLERVFDGVPDVQVYRMAIGTRSSRSVMHISGRADSSSLLPITASQEVAWPGTREVGREEVRVERADDILAGVDLPGPILIKIDVQGYELQVLEGLGHLLKQARYVYIEISFVELYEGQPLAHDVVARLLEDGFALKWICTLNRKADGSPFQCDALFENVAHDG